MAFSQVMTGIREVAELANVSSATVSRVLNGKASALVSDGTRARVLAAAAQLGYRPSASARALAAGRTHTVALTTRHLQDPHYTRLLDTAHWIARDAGYHLLLTPDVDDEHFLDLIRERRSDVVIRLRFPVDAGDEFASVDPRQALLMLGPVDHAPPQHVHSGSWDDRQGMAFAADHLADLGHRRVAFLGAPGTNRKLDFFLEAAAARKMDVIPVSAEPQGDDDVAWGVAIAKQALKLHPRPTALVAQNDNFALGALHRAYEAGLKVPRDLSVIGYNDVPLAAYSCPALTTVRTPITQCLSICLTKILDHLNGQGKETLPPVSVHLDTSVVTRQSTASPPS